MPSGAQVALAVGGPVVHALGWALVRARRVSIWASSGITMGAAGLVAVLVGPVEGARGMSASAAAGVGVAVGVGLYAATVAFMAAARRVPAVTRHTARLYGERRGRSALAALAVPLLLSVPGEELLWRGAVLRVLGEVMGSPGAGAAACWVAFVAVNTVSGSIPIVLGAVVGGATWTALAWWTGGVISSVACHLVWTALMILVPPPGARG
jgi:membrane protease YdiL (CAAX protease family)